MSAGVEYKVMRDTNLLTGDELARIKFRREGVRNWSSFVVVLDDETTFETVEANAVSLIALCAPVPAVSREGEG